MTRLGWELLLILTGACGRRAEVPADPPASASVVAAARTAPKASELRLGAPAPDVMLTLQDGFSFPLESLHGKLVTLFICRALEDESCAQETRGLAESFPELNQRRDVVVLGVSPAEGVKLRDHIALHGLPFDLVSDGSGTVARAFASRPPDERALRVFVIGRDGRILRTWGDADPAAHVREILMLAGA